MLIMFDFSRPYVPIKHVDETRHIIPFRSMALVKHLGLFIIALLNYNGIRGLKGGLAYKQQKQE